MGQSHMSRDQKFMQHYVNQHYVNGAGLRRLRAHKNAEAVRLDTVRMQEEALEEMRQRAARNLEAHFNRSFGRKP